MAPSRLLLAAGALAAAALLAWWPWRGHLASPLARLGLAARAVAITALLLLLLDPGLRRTLRPPAPLVLLDNSVSMHAARGHADSARRLAASIGDPLPFAEVAPGEPGGATRLGDALAAAVTAGRPVTIITDGEVGDASAIPPDLLAQASVVVLPRDPAPDVAITDVRMPDRLAAGDTLEAEIDVEAVGAIADSVMLEVRDGARVLLRGAAVLARDSAGVGRAVLTLRGALPEGLTGARWLEIARVGEPDAEPDDDVRWRRLEVTPSPGVIVVAALPDWDARFLLGALRDVTDGAVRGFVQLRAGAWYRMDDLRPVTVEQVRAAAAGADLLAVRGDTTPWRRSGRARLLWPSGHRAGDWYAANAGVSPISGALAMVEAESLPALPAASALGDLDWTGMVVRAARRGAEVPVIGGRTEGGRTVVIGVDGLYRWAFGGGDAEQAWRSMIAEAASWLLATPEGTRASARPVTAVTERGRPVVFRHLGEGAPAPLPIELTSEGAPRVDTLRFDAEGRASLVLPVGRYRYTLGDGVQGALAVEPYAAELVAHPPSLGARAADVAPAPLRRSLRDLLPLFALVVLGLGTEWILRRRLGLR